MKIARNRLTEIIQTEIVAALREISEDEKSKKSKKKASTAAADDEPTERNNDGGGAEPIGNAPPIDGGLNDQDGGKSDNDSDDAEENDADDAVDADGDASAQPSGAVNREISGKTVQAITLDPDSKNLPGAKEVVISFNETSDQLRIILTESGQLKFGWPCDSSGKAKQVHDLP